MNKDIIRSIDQIRNDRIHGAGWLSRRAINVLADVAAGSHADEPEVLLAHLYEATLQLKAARPDMVSIYNYVSLFEEKLKVLRLHEYTVELLIDYCLKTARQIVNRSLAATRKAASAGAELLYNRSTIITCSYSSTLCKTLYNAHKGGKTFRVIVAESLSGTKAYGKVTAEYLKRHGIAARLINDNEIANYIVRATTAMIGADSVFIDGSIINGTPSNLLANAANKAGISLYVICETAKFDSLITDGNIKSTGTGFDYIAAAYVTEIITEKGRFKPQQVIK